MNSMLSINDDFSSAILKDGHKGQDRFKCLCQNRQAESHQERKSEWLSFFMGVGIDSTSHNSKV
jgi:hypothetical protein